jgi:N-acetylmuramoyl-L-alanine amidase
VARANTFRWITALAVLTVGLAMAHVSLAQTVGVRLGVSAAGTRVVIDSPTAVHVTPQALQGQQLVFTVTGLEVNQPLEGTGQGLVSEWRLTPGPEGTRLALSLNANARIADSFAIPPNGAGTPYRYVVDLGAPRTSSMRPPGVAVASVSPPAAVPTAASARLAHGSMDYVYANSPATAGPTSFRAADGQSSRSKTYAAATPHSWSKKVIVIDAGHGGHDPGAQSADANEKDITLAAALCLRRRLLRDGRYRVVMTRAEDVFVPLEERVRIARRAGADLFIALHADSAGDNDATHGASVYTLSGHGETRVNEVLDGHEWFSHATPRDDPAVKGILLDLTQRSTLNRSNLFAQVLVSRLSETIDVLPRTHRDAGYFVLLAPDVPAVLLEMGFISSPEDEARLKDPSKRDALMNTVANSIDDYFDGNLKLAAD